MYVGERIKIVRDEIERRKREKYVNLVRGKTDEELLNMEQQLFKELKGGDL